MIYAATGEGYFSSALSGVHSTGLSFRGGGIFKSEKPERMAAAIVRAATNYKDPGTLAEISRGLGSAMPGIETDKLDESELLQTRGW